MSRDGQIFAYGIIFSTVLMIILSWIEGKARAFHRRGMARVARFDQKQRVKA